MNAPTTLHQPVNGLPTSLNVSLPPVRTLVMLGLAATVPIVAPTGLPIVARLTMSVFVFSLVAAGFTKLSEVALTVITLASLLAIGASSAGDLAMDLTGGTLWLLGGAFVVAAAAKRSGLAQRAAVRVAGSATSVSGLFTRVTLMLVGTSFLVPSTAGRAALMVPVFHAIAEQIPQRTVRRGLALLFPVGILLSAVASLLGAGAHIVTAELVSGLGGQQLDIIRWTVYGLPFALISCAAASIVIRQLFIDTAERNAALDLTGLERPGAWTLAERIVAVVMSTMIVGWATEQLHGIDMAIVAITGALAVLACRVITLDAARRAVPFDLLFLMVATVEVGKALVRTGAADWIATSILGPVVEATGATVVIVATIALLSLLAHLAVTSRTARASVLVPVVMLIGGAAGLDITAIAFLSTTAAGYCLSSATSAKPMAVFSKVGDDAYQPNDLRRLSLVLLPIHLCLLLGFAYFVWPALGLSLYQTASDSDWRAAGSTPGITVDGERHYRWERFIVEDLDVGPRWSPSPVASIESDGSVGVTVPPIPQTLPTVAPTDTNPILESPTTSIAASETGSAPTVPSTATVPAPPTAAPLPAAPPESSVPTADAPGPATGEPPTIVGPLPPSDVEDTLTPPSDGDEVVDEEVGEGGSDEPDDG